MLIIGKVEGSTRAPFQFHHRRHPPPPPNSPPSQHNHHRYYYHHHSTTIHSSNHSFYHHIGLYLIVIMIIILCHLSPGWTCEQLDFCSDRPGFEAILWLHNQLDEDASGSVDISETDEFLRDELQYEDGYERQKAFHGDDKHISVDELWRAWIRSEVHNWTSEETVEWLVNQVELPQYVQIFQQNAIDGSSLPRLAANPQFLSEILGIKNPIHRQKIALKAMDVVLFGSAKSHNYFKDALLVLSLVIAVGGCWFAIMEHKYSKSHLKKMMKDMDALARAEDQLSELQTQLDRMRDEREEVLKEKRTLEKRLENEIQSIDRNRSFDSLTDNAKLCELEHELKRTREDLRRAECALASRSWSTPAALQPWLQLTYELELRNHEGKRKAAEAQIQAAKDESEKLRKKRARFIGSFRVAHGSFIDDVDNRILQAKAALQDVIQDLQERIHRWKQIELLTGFSIVNNPGIRYLESILLESPHSHDGSPASLIRTTSSSTILDPSSDDMNSFVLGQSTETLERSVPSSAILRRKVYASKMHQSASVQGGALHNHH